MAKKKEETTQAQPEPQAQPAYRTTRKRPYVDNVSGEDLVFSYGGDRFVLAQGKTYYDEAFPAKDRDIAAQACQHAYQKFHHVFTGKQHEAESLVVTGYDVVEAQG